MLREWRKQGFNQTDLGSFLDILPVQPLKTQLTPLSSLHRDAAYYKVGIVICIQNEQTLHEIFGILKNLKNIEFTGWISNARNFRMSSEHSDMGWID